MLSSCQVILRCYIGEREASKYPGSSQERAIWQVYQGRLLDNSSKSCPGMVKALTLKTLSKKSPKVPFHHELYIFLFGAAKCSCQE